MLLENKVPQNTMLKTFNSSCLLNNSVLSPLGVVGQGSCPGKRSEGVIMAVIQNRVSGLKGEKKISPQDRKQSTVKSQKLNRVISVTLKKATQLKMSGS